MTTAPRSNDKLEFGLGVVLSATIVGLHVVRLANAGALWRDEAAAVGLATLPSIREMVQYFPHEAFPPLVPAVLRGVACVSGNSDLGFRIFGFLVGVGIVATLWWNSWVVRRNTPFVALALLGFNSVFITYGDAVRGYGLGVLFILSTVGLVWRVLEAPNPGRVTAATLGAVASVQCLLHNAPLVLAICLGGLAVACRRRAWRLAGLVLLVGLAAAGSLLPYWPLLIRARGWDVLVRKPISFSDLWLQLGDALGASGISMVWIWVLLFLGALVVVWRAQVRRSTGAQIDLRGFEEHSCLSSAAAIDSNKPRSDDADLLLFAGTALVAGFVGCFCFLKILSYATRPWYCLPAMALAAVLLDFIVDSVCKKPSASRGRLLASMLISVVCFPLAYSQVKVRQTNVDLAAAKLAQVVGKDDLVVVYPWHNGISFARYYHGPASWETLPPVAFHRFHRYDLLRDNMDLPEMEHALQPLFERIRQTLKCGQRVWLVGNFPAGSERLQGRTREAIIALTASAKAAAFLRSSAGHLKSVPFASNGPVNPYEDLPLKVLEGWNSPGERINPIH